MTGARVAKYVHVKISGASPCAKQAITCAVAGATKSKSAQSATETCSGFHGASVRQRSRATSLRESVFSVSGVINSSASRVISTRTSAPSLTKIETISAALNAAIEPVTPSAIFFPSRNGMTRASVSRKCLHEKRIFAHFRAENTSVKARLSRK